MDRLIHQSFNGLFESYLCKCTKAGFDKQVVLQGFSVGPREASFAFEIILKIANLDPRKVESLIGAYHAPKHIYIANEWIGQGQADLFQLMSLRDKFLPN